MLTWIRNWLKFRRRIKNDADFLLGFDGRNALQLARAKVRDSSLTDNGRIVALAVCREIEKRLGLKGQSDTATRYLESLSGWHLASKTDFWKCLAAQSAKAHGRTETPNPVVFLEQHKRKLCLSQSSAQGSGERAPIRCGRL